MPQIFCICAVFAVFFKQLNSILEQTVSDIPSSQQSIRNSVWPVDLLHRGLLIALRLRSVGFLSY